ncbi:MAG: addiction module protein [Deltaproteobacteria bacterium]|nr:addiction module protein [Deltaproteobacteria bacterium]
MESVLIEKEAMKLPLVERALLVDRLLQTLDDEKNSSIMAWAEVTEKRLEKFRAGEMEAFDGQAVIESLRKELR